MNYYKIVGQITAKTSNFLSKMIGFKNIISFSINTDNITINLKDGRTAEIKYNNPGVRGVYWTIEDFEYRAIDKWQYVLGRGNYPNATSWKDIYDESKFQEALDKMIHKHDASYGISWETVDFWLDEICLKPKEDEE